MIKVLTVITSHFGIDGISNVATNYYLYQDHKAIDIDFVVINKVPSILQNEIDNNNNNIYILPYRNKNPLKYIYSLVRIILKNKYDIIHIHGNSSTMLVEVIAACIAKIKTRIVHVHTTSTNYPFINKLLNPFLLKYITNAFACSQEAGSWIFKDKLKFDIIKNGININQYQYDKYTRDILKEKYSIKDKFVIGHAGRFSKEKNHKMILDIFEEFCKIRPNSKLILIGDGILRKEIEAEGVRRNLDILFTGNSNDVKSWIQTMDVVLFPSLFEGVPLFLIEAQTAGLPCLISDKVSRLAQITDFVKIIPLEEPPFVWAQCIFSVDISKREEKEKYLTKIRESGFDIINNCEQLRRKYLQLINDNNEKS